MDIIEALKIMEFTDIGDVTKELLSKSFRKLIRIHHPDLFYNDSIKLAENESIAKKINEANEKLNNMLSQLEAIRQLEKLSKKEEVFAIIPLESLHAIYSGKAIKLKSSDSTFELNKYNIREHRIYLYIECIIICNNITTTFSVVKPFITSDEYTIDCNVTVKDENSLFEVQVKTFNKNVNVSLKNIETKLTIRYDNGIKLKVHIRKKVETVQ